MEAQVSRETISFDQNHKLYFLVTSSNNNEVHLTTISNHEEINLLRTAIKSRNYKVTKELLKLPFDVNCDFLERNESGLYKKSRCIDSAWANEDYDIVLKLLEANSMYPMMFTRTKASDRIKNFLKISENMHGAIKTNNHEQVVQILYDNEGQRYFFTSINYSAANLALKLKNTAFYRTLAEHNVTFGPDEFISNMQSDFNDSICDLNSELAKPMPEHHILILLSRSVIPRGDPNYGQRLQAIKEAFETINRIPRVKLLLQVIATSRRTKLHFDFTQTSVMYMDPTVGKSTRGLFNAANHHLHIAAKNLLKSDTKKQMHGTISHEPGHSGMNLVFRNVRLPYDAGDEKNKARFDAVVEECKNLMIKKKQANEPFEPIVEAVFNYGPAAHARELIVRVPHMLAHYQDDEQKIAELMKTFKSLFDYYDEVVVPAMEAALPVLEKLSSEADIKFSELTEPLKAAVLHSDVDFQGQTIKWKQITGAEVLEELTSKQIRDILNRQVLSIGAQSKATHKFYAERTFIDSRFNGRSWDWINNKNEFALTKEAAVSACGFESLIAKSSHLRLFLLADHAGAGKSTTIAHLGMKLKEQLSDRWICCIDLKRHLHVYDKFKQTFDSSNARDILMEMLSPADGIECAVFSHLFETGKMVLLLDGVDEIAPKFTDLFLGLVTSIKALTMNQQWIATRPQFTEELKVKLNLETAYKLVPFNSFQAETFIKQFFKIIGINGDQQLLDSCFKVIETLGVIESPLMLSMVAELHATKDVAAENLNRFSLYKAVIELKKGILAEKGAVANRDRDIDSSVNLWKVHWIYAMRLFLDDGKFEDLLSQEFLEWRGLGSGTDYEKKFVNFGQFKLFKEWEREKSNWSPEAIARCGFLIVDHWDTLREFPDFSHRTFAEFFLAQFLVDVVREAIEDGDDMSEAEFEMRMKIALVFVRYSFSGVHGFITDLIETIQSKKIDFCEKFLKFLERSDTEKFIERMSSDVLKLIAIVSVLVKLSRYNERVLRAVTLARDGTSKLFQIALKNSGIPYFPCVKLFNTFKDSNLPNWHRLTGFGMELSQVQINLPDDIEKLFRENFIPKHEVLVGYKVGSGVDFLDRFSDDDDYQNFKLYHQFFGFIASVEITLENNKSSFSEILSRFPNDPTLTLSRSRSSIEKLFEVFDKHFSHDKNMYFSGVSKFMGCWSLDSLIKSENGKIGQKFIDNFDFFHQKLDIFLDSDRQLMQQRLLEGEILCFAIATKSEVMRHLYRKYFDTTDQEKICSSLVHAFEICLVHASGAEKIKDFNEFCADLTEFSTIFQLMLNCYKNMEIFSKLVDAYKMSCAKKWQSDTGFEPKSSEQSIILEVSEKELTEMANEAFPLNKKQIPKFINYFHLLSFIEQYEIPSSHLERFFSNMLGQFLNFAINSHEVLVNKVISLLKLHRNNECILEILKNSLKTVTISEDRIIENIQLPLVFDNFYEKLDELTCGDKKLMRELLLIISIADNPNINILFLAINFDMKNILKFYRSLFTPGEIIKMFLTHIDQILSFKNPKQDNFKKFFGDFSESLIEFSQSDFVRTANDENEGNFKKLSKESEILSSFLHFIAKAKILQSDLEEFFFESLSIVLYFAIRSRSMIDKIFEILFKNFINDKAKVALWIRKGFDLTALINPKSLKNQRITVECRSLIEYFWLKVEDFFGSDSELIRTLLLCPYYFNHPLIIGIYYDIDKISNFFFKFCNTHEILKIFTTALGSIARYFDSKSIAFEMFFVTNFLSVENKKSELKLFLGSFDVILDAINIEKEELRNDNFVNKKEKIENIENFTKFLFKIASEVS
jgi:hypothetical protein